jgi:DNA-binding CsgD family transcriptional regulator
MKTQEASNKDNVALTPKEVHMLELLTQGLSSEKIAQQIGHKEGTTRVYLHAMYRKLGVQGAKEAIAQWVRNTSLGGDALRTRATELESLLDGILSSVKVEKTREGNLGLVLCDYKRLVEALHRAQTDRESASKRKPKLKVKKAH